MKNLIFLILISWVSSSTCVAQDAQIKFYTEYNGSEYEFNPDKPIDSKSFLMRFLKDVKYPTIARENAIQGRVVISCYLDELGILNRAVLSKGFYRLCDEEALRVVSANIGQRLLEPLQLEGHPVKVRFDIPIKFMLN